MSKLIGSYLMIPAVLMVAGCSNLDSSSDFFDVADEVNERRHFVQVIAKDINPDARVISGQDLVKSELHFVGIYPKTEDKKVMSSYIDMNVTYFKKYDSFTTVSFDGQTQKLDTYLPISETCSEHCTNTQSARFNISNEYLSQLNSDEVVFTIKTSSDRNAVQLSVPKAYFDAVADEANEYTRSSGVPNEKVSERHNDESRTSAIEDKSKNQEMVEYWFSEASDEDKTVFVDWAFSSADLTTSEVEALSKPLEMMVYWFNKSSKPEKIAILSNLAK